MNLQAYKDNLVSIYQNNTFQNKHDAIKFLEQKEIWSLDGFLSSE